MTKVVDIDERGQTRPHTALADEIVTRLRCDHCGHVTLVTKTMRTAIIAKLDPQYPARTVTIDCKCGSFQHVVQARPARRS